MGIVDMGICIVQDCQRDIFCKDMCTVHDARMRRNGNIKTLIESNIGKICKVETCESSAHCKGLCKYHYDRKAHGYGPVRTRGVRGLGSITTQGYAAIMVNGKHKLKHRIIMEKILNRELLPQESVHHKNGNRLDNRPENLELWSRFQPAGQRVEDLVSWAKEILNTYS